MDFNSQRVVLGPGTTKNDEGRLFLFTDELESVLRAQRTQTDELRKEGTVCPFVFHHNGSPVGEFRSSWKTACKKAGLPGRIFHDFRRTAVRNLVRANVSERVAMKLTGHKTRSVFERYNIVSDGDLETAGQAAGGFSRQHRYRSGHRSPITGQVTHYSTAVSTYQ